jgi:uncharacterized protein (TIGR00255 family)
MTGYGRGMAERAGRRVTVEIRAVNHRFLDLKLRGTVLEPALEERLTGAVRARIGRGSVAVTLRMESPGGGAGVRADLGAARRVLRELHGLAESVRLPPRVSLDLLCAQPGVLVPLESELGGDALAQLVMEAMQQALEMLVAMREAEGAALAADLEARTDRLLRLCAELEQLAARAPEEARRRLEERITRLLAGSNVELDAARVAQEVAVLADRLDVTEELVRVRSHVHQLRQLLQVRDEPVGRRLDFLVQELGREFNTVSSKSQSADIGRLAVEGKAELEKVREQVQNIE